MPPLSAWPCVCVSVEGLFLRVLGLRLSSSRRHGEFLRLLFLQAHRETAAHFTAIAMPQPNGPRPGYPRYGHCFLIQSLTLARAFARSHSLSLPLTALSLSLSLSLSLFLSPSLPLSRTRTYCLLAFRPPRRKNCVGTVEKGLLGMCQYVTKRDK